VFGADDWPLMLWREDGAGGAQRREALSGGCASSGRKETEMQEKTTKPQAKDRELKSGLIGRAFHTFRETKSGQRGVVYQGIVRARIEDGLYLVQYFEWLVGEPSTLELVRIEDMLNWQFYEDTEHMNFWYEHRYHKPDDADTIADDADNTTETETTIR
jgi:hypothetical protein